MLQTPQEIYNDYNLLLNNRNIPKSEHYNFRKWLRYYLNFCKKNNHSESKNESLPLFIKKLQEKRQSSNQQKQAAHAKLLSYSLLRPASKNSLSNFNERLPEKEKPSIKQNQSTGSVQNNNPEKQVNPLNLRNAVTFEKAKTSRNNKVPHSATCDYPIKSNYYNNLANSINEKVKSMGSNLIY